MGHPHQRLRFLLGRALVRYHLGQALAVDPAVPTFTQTAEGKPYLLGPERSLHFSLSHSGQWVVLGLTDGCPLGIDLEHPLRDRPLLGIARHYFHPQEVAHLTRLVGREQVRAFYRLWTLKEAFFKARGTGLSEGLEKVCFSFGELQARIDPLLQTEAGQWSFRHWHNPVADPDPCYLALAVPQPTLAAPQMLRTLPDVYCRPLVP